ncbi:short chain dehydrogenase [Pedobacter chinensis]|uniref:Short chain dehydrogenase n=1 Tax=Pedobacter chinensis TaxID=2282421 RepID=A0A369PZR7_9SPHI|nr:SDR family oxidoreductase [Pedobacter chinensis]RDC58181.1 short chain dehydrogenase [Pedobacter chinensis]
MNLDLKDKVILVSGGAKGIGAAIVKMLAAEQAFPIIIGRNQTDNEKLLKEIRLLNYNADYQTAELTQPGSCKIVVDDVLKKYGRIDGIVNNAGVNDSIGLETGNDEDFIASLHKNLVHYYSLVHHALPALKKSKGTIVNIGSKTADTGQGGTSGYAAANGGRNALTREWAVELLPFEIRVNAVIVAEAMTPLYQKWLDTFDDPEGKLKMITQKIPLEKRMTKTEEIANMVVFLLSKRSSHTTGQLIYVDGGYVHLDRAIT